LAQVPPNNAQPDTQQQLIYLHGGEPGFGREHPHRESAILDARGREVTDEETLARVRALAIPPAWTDVWIATDPDAHLQATGIDSKGRRQYLYHPLWRLRREEEKFEDMLEFAQRLPGLRAMARRVLSPDRGPPVDRTTALALSIRLLDVGMFRVGWDRYARDNGHVGLTTLQRQNVTLGAAEVRFDFIAKSGKRRRMTLRDPESVPVLSHLKRRRGMPEELLVYRSDHGWHRIHAADVNNALRSWCEGPYSAKEFRTWSATVLAAVALSREHAAGRSGPRAINRAVRQVSTALGNTPAVARSSYIDPRVITLFEDGSVIELPEGLPPEELPLRIETGPDGVVFELPTDVDGDTVRLEIEHQVRGLLLASR
jgi:DNA topoisomerase-1